MKRIIDERDLISGLIYRFCTFIFIFVRDRPEINAMEVYSFLNEMTHTLPHRADRIWVYHSSDNKSFKYGK